LWVQVDNQPERFKNHQIELYKLSRFCLLSQCITSYT
jgi:hypothetical protein